MILVQKMRKLKALLQKFPNRKFMWQSRLVENVTMCPTWVITALHELQKSAERYIFFIFIKSNYTSTMKKKELEVI